MSGRGSGRRLAAKAVRGPIRVVRCPGEGVPSAEVFCACCLQEAVRAADHGAALEVEHLAQVLRLPLCMRSSVSLSRSGTSLSLGFTKAPTW